MVNKQGDRSKFFPSIETKYGKPMSHWFGLLNKLGDAKYVEQMDLLRLKFGFSQAHANAVVMHHRGSKTSRRHDDPLAYFESIGSNHAGLIKAMISAIQKRNPRLQLVIAWNQPMLKLEKDYVIGFSAAKSHITVGPWGENVIEAFAEELTGYETNKKTFKVPLDWKVDKNLLTGLVTYRLNELK